jgi:pilus assembly protein CpaC
MFLQWKLFKNGLALILALVGLLSFTGHGWSADFIVTETREAAKLNLISRKSIILRSSKPVKRISEPAPDIAEAIALSPHEIYITGKGAGTTNLILWLDEGLSAIYDLEVEYDVAGLKQKLHEVLPSEDEIRVFAMNDSITLSGKISNSSNLSQALALAESYAQKGKVRNLLEVGGVHQVMLEVRVAEMSRNLVRRFGINFNYFKNGEFFLTTLSGLTQLVRPDEALVGAGAVGLAVSPTVNALFRFNSGGATWTAFIDALKEDGLVKILAEPTLLALSGQTASFLAGGEFPIPVPQGLQQVTIQFKEFGVRLFFTPTVLSDGRISMKVSPEVSNLDPRTAITITGFQVPGLITRRATTTVELADGQSFAIAGLLNETVRDTTEKYPFLGDIPILGILFRSKAFQKEETELVIIATPRLVKPFNQDKQPLPTEPYIEPNDTESYIEGLTEGREKENSKAMKGEMDGQFGHAIPES